MNWNQLVQWTSEPFAGQLAVAILGVVILLGGVRMLGRQFLRRVDHSDDRYRLRKLFSFGGYLLCALFLTIVYREKLGNLTTAFGLASAGIAFALQEVIASGAGWVAIMLGGFFRIGDRVQLGGIKGDVIDIGVLRTTVMELGQWVDGDLYNGRIVRIANSFVFKEPVFNYSGDFPFLWDEVKVPVKYGSDMAVARTLLETALTETVGGYVPTARASWTGLVRRYMIEDASVEPMVTLVANDNWVEFTLRYVVEFKRRRFTKDAVFRAVLAAVDGSSGKVGLASATFQLVEAPPLRVKLDQP